MVVDLGGGTFDVTVMEYDGAELKVRATGGDAYLGGANFDKVLFDRFVERLESAHGLNINDPDALSLDECAQVSQDWLLRAARAKHDLTSRDRTSVALQAAGLTLQVDVTRAEFVSGSAVLLDEMTKKMADVVAAAGVTSKDISVVFAGRRRDPDAGRQGADEGDVRRRPLIHRSVRTRRWRSAPRCSPRSGNWSGAARW